MISLRILFAIVVIWRCSVGANGQDSNSSVLNSSTTISSQVEIVPTSMPPTTIPISREPIAAPVTAVPGTPSPTPLAPTTIPVNIVAPTIPVADVQPQPVAPVATPEHIQEEETQPQAQIGSQRQSGPVEGKDSIDESEDDGAYDNSPTLPEGSPAQGSGRGMLIAVICIVIFLVCIVPGFLSFMRARSKRLHEQSNQLAAVKAWDSPSNSISATLSAVNAKPVHAVSSMNHIPRRNSMIAQKHDKRSHLPISSSSSSDSAAISNAPVHDIAVRNHSMSASTSETAPYSLVNSKKHRNELSVQVADDVLSGIGPLANFSSETPDFKMALPRRTESPTPSDAGNTTDANWFGPGSVINRILKQMERVSLNNNSTSSIKSAGTGNKQSRRASDSSSHF